LPRLTAEILAEAGRLAGDDALAVTIGPGSFTGLRIALSFAKGLAFAGGHRLVGIPTLDALAVTAPVSSDRVCAALDARKREIYAALYERAGDRLVRCGEPTAVGAERLAAMIAGPCTFIGDAVEAYGEVFRNALVGSAHIVASSCHPAVAIAVGRLAAARLRQMPAGDDVRSLAPTYVRPPEAELTQSVHSPSTRGASLEFVDKVPIVY